MPLPTDRPIPLSSLNLGGMGWPPFPFSSFSEGVAHLLPKGGKLLEELGNTNHVFKEENLHLVFQYSQPSRGSIAEFNFGKLTTGINPRPIALVPNKVGDRVLCVMVTTQSFEPRWQNFSSNKEIDWPAKPKIHPLQIAYPPTPKTKLSKEGFFQPWALVALALNDLVLASDIESKPQWENALGEARSFVKQELGLSPWEQQIPRYKASSGVWLRQWEIVETNGKEYVIVSCDEMNRLLEPDTTLGIRCGKWLMEGLDCIKISNERYIYLDLIASLPGTRRRARPDFSGKHKISRTGDSASTWGQQIEIALRKKWF